MASHEIMNKYVAKQGWNAASQADVLMRYVENQQSDDAVLDHLTAAAVEEEADVERCRDIQDVQDVQTAAGWTDETLVSLLLDYIENQQSDDAFEDFLALQAAEENDQDELEP